jgi:hypothetical protein
MHLQRGGPGLKPGDSGEPVQAPIRLLPQRIKTRIGPTEDSTQRSKGRLKDFQRFQCRPACHTQIMSVGSDKAWGSLSGTKQGSAPRDRLEVWLDFQPDNAATD